MILTEELKPISPQEAKDKNLFGPVYHGATSDKLEKINIQGFKIPIGHERSGDVSHGYEMGGYGYGPIPCPIHHLGFGVYLTTSKTIAKQFSYGNTKIGPYFLDVPRIETINFGSTNTMMKWWLKNGYDYKITPETTFGSGKTDLHLMREERMRATLHLTETLKSKYDAVWFKGKGIRGRLLDGDQVVVFDPNRIYKVDKSLIKPGEIGSKVIAKVDIDLYGRGNIAVYAGTRGIIIDKKKPTEFQMWTEGSEWIYTIRWEKGGITDNIIDKFIEPYTSKRGLKEIDNEIKTYYPISKQEEMEVVNYILKHIDDDQARKNLKKVKHIKKYGIHGSSAYFVDIIDYETYSDNVLPMVFYIRNMGDGVGFSSYRKHYHDLINKWKVVIPYQQKLEENTNIPRPITYYEITKIEEQQVIDYIKKEWNTDEISKTLKKVKHDKKTKHSDGNFYDKIDYSAIWRGRPVLFLIRKNELGLSYRLEDVTTNTPMTSYKLILLTSQKLEENTIIRRNFWKDYAKLLKENNNRFWSFKMAKPIAEKIKAKIVGSVLTKGKSEHDLDLRVEKWDDQIKTTLEGLGFEYNGSTIVSPEEVKSSKKRYGNGWQRGYYFINNEGKIIQVWHDEETTIQEGDAEYSTALRQAGYWGRQGAGAIILAKDTGRILLPLRSNSVEQPNTWGVWGGAIDENENPASAVRRELSEEVGHQLQIDELLPLYVYEDPRVGFRYSNFLAVIQNEFTPKLNWETQKSEWVKYGMWPKPIHFGLKLLLSHSSNEIKNEVKKYSKDLQNVKTPAIQREKFKAAVDLINKTWDMMYRGGEIQNSRDRFNSEDVNMWLLNDRPTQELLEQYGLQFYPQDHEPGYRFLKDVDDVLGKLEARFYKRISKKLDPKDPLSALKMLVRGKSWIRAKYDLAKFSLSGPIIPEKENISDKEANDIFDRIFRVSMGETFYDVNKMNNLPPLSLLKHSEDNIINNFIKYYIPKDKTEFPTVVKVYRGTPSYHTKIRPGDFTSFDKNYVRYYIRGKYGAVVSDDLPSKDLRVYKLEPGQSELIYWPVGHQIQKYTGHVPTFKEFYLQYK